MAPLPTYVVRSSDPAQDRRRRWSLAAIWLASLLLTALLTSALMRHSADAGSSAALRVAQERSSAQDARIAQLARSEQVAKAALADLQTSLRDRDEEIDGLRADLAFYGRLLGGKREGLTVHALRLMPVAGSRAWNFVATLTQNFKRGEETSGRIALTVEGVVDGRLETLDWKTLAQDPNAGGIAYAFKYFAQVRGTMMLPDGFVPNRVVVRAEGDGARAEQAFTWADASKGQENDNVPQ